jgi:SAM-dependent methyltransferase
MPSTPIAPDWDARYRDASTPWDLGGHAALIQRLAAQHLAEKSDILVPGCGLAHDVESLAKRGHRVVGLDIAPTAVAQATSRLEARGVESGTVRLGDFLSPDAAPEAAFDALIEHTCYCALAPSRWPHYVAAAARALKPGGLLLGAFLSFDGGGPPFGTSLEALRSQFEPAFEILHLQMAPERFEPKDVPQMEAVFQRRTSP